MTADQERAEKWRTFGARCFKWAIYLALLSYIPDELMTSFALVLVMASCLIELAVREHLLGSKTDD